MWESFHSLSGKGCNCIGLSGKTVVSVPRTSSAGKVKTHIPYFIQEVCCFLLDDKMSGNYPERAVK